MDTLSEYRFAIENELNVDEFIDILQRSTLAERRPLHDRPRMQQMLHGAGLIITARAPDGLLVGVARALTDYAYCTYLADLAVDVTFQRRGLGKELIEMVRRTTGSDVKLILLAAPAAADYYPHIGFTHHDSCWTLP